MKVTLWLSYFLLAQSLSVQYLEQDGDPKVVLYQDLSQSDDDVRIEGYAEPLDLLSDTDREHGEEGSNVDPPNGSLVVLTRRSWLSRVFLSSRSAHSSISSRSSSSDPSPALNHGLEKKGGGFGRGGGSIGGSRGGSSGSKGGSKGGSRGSKGGSRSKGDSKPDKSTGYANKDDPPPPYSPRDGSSGPPPPYQAGTYGQRGPSPNYWNGQYYPYSRYGYGSFLPVAGFAAPFFLAGPYGFYGPYAHAGGGSGAGRGNASVSDIYVNGTQTEDGTWVNGTFMNTTYIDGEYTLKQYRGAYENGTKISDNVVVNGTLINGALIKTQKINPNFTVNGTELHAETNSASPSSSANAFAVVGALLLANAIL